MRHSWPSADRCGRPDPGAPLGRLARRTAAAVGASRCRRGLSTFFTSRWFMCPGQAARIRRGGRPTLYPAEVTSHSRESPSKPAIGPWCAGAARAPRPVSVVGDASYRRLPLPPQGLNEPRDRRRGAGASFVGRRSSRPADFAIGEVVDPRPPPRASRPGTRLPCGIPEPLHRGDGGPCEAGQLGSKMHDGGL